MMQNRNVTKMKRWLAALLAAACLMLPLTSPAQKGFTLQLRVSPGISMGGRYEVYAHNLMNPNFGMAYINLGRAVTFGMEAGGALGYNVTDHIGLSLGALYSKQGQIYNNFQEFTNTSMQTSTLKREIALHYLKFPLQCTYMIRPDEPVSILATAGLYVAWMTGYNDLDTYDYSNKPTMTCEATGDTYTVSNGSATVVSEFTNGPPYTALDVGGVIGLGLRVRLSKMVTIPVMLTYQAGFIDIKNKACAYLKPGESEEESFWQNGDPENPNASLPYRNAALELTVGVTFIFR